MDLRRFLSSGQKPDERLFDNHENSGDIRGVFGDRTSGSLFHSDKNALQTPGDPEKEVYGGNITDKQNGTDAIRVSELKNSRQR